MSSPEHNTRRRRSPFRSNTKVPSSMPIMINGQNKMILAGLRDYSTKKIMASKKLAINHLQGKPVLSCQIVTIRETTIIPFTKKLVKT